MLKRRRFRRVPRLKGQTVSKMIPNIITVGALSAGFTAIRFAFDGKWEFAVVAILVAAILDALDGRMARLLKSASDFGAELDSLSDVIAFGVAPAVVIYVWALSSVDGPGWIAALFFVVCAALRLARFNTTLGKLPPYAYNYFTGVPAPAGAGLAILPLVVSFEAGRRGRAASLGRGKLACPDRRTDGQSIADVLLQEIEGAAGLCAVRPGCRRLAGRGRTSRVRLGGP